MPRSRLRSVTAAIAPEGPERRLRKNGSTPCSSRRLRPHSIGWHGQENALIAAGADERRRYAAAAAAGDVDKAFVFAGERVDLIHEIEPAEVILNRIVTEAESVLAQQFH
jgi:hypothetical protein